MTRTPKKSQTKVSPKSEPVMTDEKYIGQTEPYKPPENMVALNDERYMKKDRIGKQKAVRGPGHSVTKIGLGGLEVITQNPINYHGDIDV